MAGTQLTNRRSGCIGPACSSSAKCPYQADANASVQPAATARHCCRSQTRHAEERDVTEAGERESNAEHGRNT